MADIYRERQRTIQIVILACAAALVLKADLDLHALNAWIRERIPAYKAPRRYKILAELPRNAMGKVTKNDLKKILLS